MEAASSKEGAKRSAKETKLTIILTEELAIIVHSLCLIRLLTTTIADLTFLTKDPRFLFKEVFLPRGELHFFRVIFCLVLLISIVKLRIPI